MKNEKVKKISKVIRILSKIAYIFSIVGIAIMILVAAATPYIVKKTDGFRDLEIVENKNIKLFSFNGTEDLTLVNFADNYTKTEQVMIIELYSVVAVVGFVFMHLLFRKVYKLFYNIEKGDTPFTKENIELIKVIAKRMIFFVLIPSIIGSCVEGVTNLNIGFGIDLTGAIVVLVIYALSYIFEYGYELQEEADETL